MSSARSNTGFQQQQQHSYAYKAAYEVMELPPPSPSMTLWELLCCCCCTSRKEEERMTADRIFEELLEQDEIQKQHRMKTVLAAMAKKLPSGHHHSSRRGASAASPRIDLNEGFGGAGYYTPAVHGGGGPGEGEGGGEGNGNGGGDDNDKALVTANGSNKAAFRRQQAAAERARKATRAQLAKDLAELQELFTVPESNDAPIPIVVTAARHRSHAGPHHRRRRRSSAGGGGRYELPPSHSHFNRSSGDYYEEEGDHRSAGHDHCDDDDGDGGHASPLPRQRVVAIEINPDGTYRYGSSSHSSSASSDSSSSSVNDYDDEETAVRKWRKGGMREEDLLDDVEFSSHSASSDSDFGKHDGYQNMLREVAAMEARRKAEGEGGEGSDEMRRARGARGGGDGRRRGSEGGGLRGGGERRASHQQRRRSSAALGIGLGSFCSSSSPDVGGGPSSSSYSPHRHHRHARRKEWAAGRRRSSGGGGGGGADLIFLSPLDGSVDALGGTFVDPMDGSVRPLPIYFNGARRRRALLGLKDEVLMSVDPDDMAAAKDNSTTNSNKKATMGAMYGFGGDDEQPRCSHLPTDEATLHAPIYKAWQKGKRLMVLPPVQGAVRLMGGGGAGDAAAEGLVVRGGGVRPLNKL